MPTRRAQRHVGEFGRQVRLVEPPVPARSASKPSGHVAELHVAGLRHEAADHAVEGDVVVGAFAHQLLDLLDMLGRESGRSATVTSPSFKVMIIVFVGLGGLAENAAANRPRRQRRGKFETHESEAPGASVREFRRERLRDRLGHEGTNIAAHRRDLAHQCGGNGSHRGAGGKETRSATPAPWSRSCRPSAFRSRGRCRRAGRGS
jgi:hypothetical protein